jgi:hypothetical protein
MNSREQVASRILDSISESLSFEPDTLARVEGQFVTLTTAVSFIPFGTAAGWYVTIPEG